MKKILQISFMVILIAGAVFLVAFTDREHQFSVYKHFSIEVLNPSEQALITTEEINKLVTDNFGNIEGALVSRIDLFKLEEYLLADPYISVCEVFQTINGGLIVKTRVREPLVRVINLDGQQYFLDYNGFTMPVNPAHPSHVLVANGLIEDQFVSLDKTEKPLNIYPDSSLLHQIYPVAYYIASDEFLKSFIDQVYINDNKEIELVPKIGSQVIIFGNAADAHDKLENLKTFYQKVMNKTDWNTYKSINVKYKSQVVCAK